MASRLALWDGAHAQSTKYFPPSRCGEHDYGVVLLPLQQSRRQTVRSSCPGFQPDLSQVPGFFCFDLQMMGFFEFAISEGSHRNEMTPRSQEVKKSTFRRKNIAFMNFMHLRDQGPVERRSNNQWVCLVPSDLAGGRALVNRTVAG